MIHAIGIDAIEIARVAESLRRFGDRFKERVFTESECRYCGRRSDPFPHFAARFAAKEALMKALGTGWGQGVEWKQIEVCSAPAGSPSLRLSGRAAELCGSLRIHLSLTHSRTIAAAVVVLESAGE